MSTAASARRIEVDLDIGDRTWPALAARVEEGMSELGGAWIELALGEDLDIEQLLEEEAVVTVTWAGEEIRRFTMRLARGRFLDERDGALRYELELRPALWFLGLDRNTRKFRDETTEAIVSRVLDEGRVRHAWRTTRPTASRPYCVQYRETNLAFVLRLLEYEGVYYSFDPDGVMILADASSASRPAPGKAVYTMMQAAGALSHGDFEVTSFERGAAVGSGKATVNDYSWKTPKLSLLASATGARDAHLEVYDYPTGYRDPGMGAVLAKLRLEALEAQKRFAEGTSSVPGFTPARTFDFQHDEAASFSGRWLLVHVEHRFRAGGEGVIAYENRFRAIPAEVPFRPALVTPWPIVAGNHTAMVRGPAGEEIHTDRYGRAKVQLHWDREARGTDEDSRWIRTLQEISTSIALSRVGWEISVGYIDGDPDRPIGLARLINGQMVPTYGQPANRNRMTIRTETYPGKAGYNELRMDDSGGSMTMDWHAQKDMRNVVRHDRTETIGQNLTVLIQKGSSRVVEKDQAVEIGANEIRNVSRDAILKVEKDRAHTIAGSETVNASGEADATVDGNDTETVGSIRMTRTGSFGVPVPSPKELIKSLVPSAGDVASKAAGASFGSSLGSIAQSVVPTPKQALSAATGGLSDIRSLSDLTALLKGSIDRAVQKRFTRMVGGAQVAMAGGSIAHEAGKLLVEAVGGAKLTVAATEGIRQAVSGYLMSAVGGLVLRKSKGDMSVSAKKTSVNVGAAATLSSAERVELRGTEIDVTAAEKLTLDAGDLVIEMTPDKVTLKGSVKLESGDRIKVRGNPDKLTA